MRTIAICLLAAGGVLAGCAHAVPTELTNARRAYQEASQGPAAEAAPAELHKARVALTLAEQAFVDEPDAQATRDLAYVAERKAELADALARAELDRQDLSRAQSDAQRAEAARAAETAAALSQTRQQLADVERARREEAEAEARQRAEAERVRREEQERAQSVARAQKEEQERLEAERLARLAAEQKTAELNRQLAELQAREEERGTVITLSGSVLFGSGQAMLLPDSQRQLERVAEALLAPPQRGRSIVVEGHTDSRGAEAYNQFLSQRRAEAVRDYLISRGIPAERVRAVGIGEQRPVGDNGTAEGRANNRRVEIVLERSPGR